MTTEVTVTKYNVTVTNNTTTNVVVTVDVPGPQGADGVGVPTGGTTGQVLKKASNANYDTAWSAGGADTALSNLASTAIDSDLLPATPLSFSVGAVASTIDTIYAQTANINGITISNYSGDTLVPAAQIGLDSPGSPDFFIASSAGAIILFPFTAVDLNSTPLINAASILVVNGPNGVTIKSPALAASYDLTLPVDAGTAGEALTTDGAGILSWSNLNTPSSSAISASAIDWSILVKTGGVYTKTLGANTTFTFSNQAVGTIVVRLTNTASNYTVTWPAVKWAGGAAPVMTVGAKSDIYTFIYDGTDTYGAAVQDFH